MRTVWTVVLVLVLAGCGGDDAPPDEDLRPTEEPTSPAPSESPRPESTLAAWPQLFKGSLGDHMTAAEAKAMLGLEAEPEVTKSSHAETWRYRWRSEGKKYEVSLSLMPLSGESLIFGNAQGYKRVAEHGGDEASEAIDLGHKDVWAFWRVQRSSSKLMVFTRTAIFSVSVKGLPPAEGKKVATKIARHIFDTNR